METLTELVELPLDHIEVLSKGSEANSELSFLLFKCDQSSKERWDQVVFALAEHLHHHFLFVG